MKDYADEIMGTDEDYYARAEKEHLGDPVKRTGIYACTGNQMERSDCVLHDQKCHHRGCEKGICKPEPEVQEALNEIELCEEHGGVKGFCLDCAYPDTERNSLKRELETTQTALNESDENFELVCSALVDAEKALIKEKDAHGETKRLYAESRAHEERWWMAAMRSETEVMRCIRAFTTISSIAGDLLNAEKRTGPTGGMSGLRNGETNRGSGSTTEGELE